MNQQTFAPPLPFSPQSFAGQPFAGQPFGGQPPFPAQPFAAQSPFPPAPGFGPGPGMPTHGFGPGSPPPFPPFPPAPGHANKTLFIGIGAAVVVALLVVILWATGVFGGGKSAPKNDAEIVQMLPGRWSLDCNGNDSMTFRAGGIFQAGQAVGQWQVQNGTIVLTTISGNQIPIRVTAIGSGGMDAVLPTGEAKTYQKCS